MSVTELVRLQREALRQHQQAMIRSGSAQDWRAAYPLRKQKLEKLRQLILSHEDRLLAALRADLGKGAAEGYLTEIGFVLAELSYCLKHLRRWMRPQPVWPNLATFPARAQIMPEPYGLVLIIAPWNYPVQLTLGPLVSALAAGNRCLIKPSEQAPHSADALAALANDWGDQAELAMVLGDKQVSQQLLQERFDFIFYTGGAAVGKLVMEQAARHLTPLALELGGKSPCIVDASADITLAAKRIAFGKLLNAGQTCVAPDFVLVDRAVQDRLVAEIRAQFQAQSGPDALANPDWPMIISDRHVDRLRGLVEATGSELVADPRARRIAPTLITDAGWDSPLMQEEIFGPILPVIAYEDFDEALIKLAVMEKPLALYIFSRHQARIDKLLHSLSFGGGCVNDSVMHLSHPRLPFGGVGNSGMGSYHGKHGFDCFTHRKAILRRGRIDIPFRYPPYTNHKLKLIKRFLK